MDYTNKSLGLRVQTQIPLNVIEYAASEEDLKNLGINNNLAFVYTKGLIIYCILEGTRYEWKEIELGDIGLLDNNFVYPDNIVAFGIDYSNKEYNFVNIKVPLQGLQSVLETGNLANLTVLNSQASYEMSESYFYAELTNLNKSGAIEVSPTASFLSNGIADGKISSIRLEEGDFELKKKITNGQFVQINIEDALADSITYINFPAKSPIGNINTYTVAMVEDIPIITGSETKLVNGTNTTVNGTGTIIDPYYINVPTPTPTDGSETKIINGTNSTIVGNGTIATPYQVNVTIPPSTGVQSLVQYLPTWSTDNQHALAPALSGKTIISVTPYLECTVANNGFNIGDTVTVNVPEMADSGGLGQQGMGVQWNNATPTAMYVLVADNITIMGAYVATGNQADPITPNPSDFRIKVVILYI